MATGIVDVVGRTYGKIKVHSLQRVENSTAIWACRCECGNESFVRSRDLPKTKSCGRCPVLPIEADPVELAWLAGFFDGEGCISIRHAKRPANRSAWFVLQVSITNTHRNSLQRIKDLFGFGTLHERANVPQNRKTIYTYMLGGRQAECALLTLLPYLFVKREQAKMALEFRSLGQKKPYQLIPTETYERMLELAEGIRQLNGRNARKDTPVIVPRDYVEV
jgi:hypothetical protein